MKRRPPSSEPEWSSAVWPNATVRVLAIDQALVNSGWVLLLFGDGYPPSVLEFGTIHSTPQVNMSGFADSFVRGEHLFGAFRALVMSTEPHLVVHEMPALQTKVMSRNREAPIVAAMAVRCATSSLGYRTAVGMMQAQRVKKWMTGNGNAVKSVVREQVESVLVFDGRINEHISDAAAIGMAAALDGTIEELLKQFRTEPAPIGKV